MDLIDYYKSGRISITRTKELNKMIVHLSKKYNLKPQAVITYCIARVYNKEIMDEKRMMDYLDGGMIKWWKTLKRPYQI